MHMEQKKLEEKNQSLIDAFKEKSKKQQQLQKMYTQLKQQQMAAGLEVAADYDADNVLHNAAAATHNDAGYRDGRAAHGRSGSGGSGGKRNNTAAWTHTAPNNRAGMQSSRRYWCRPHSA
jgi:E3 ubiquitin-protein ligase CCNP1IP1